MNWLRWHHGTTKDPKWRVVANMAGIPVGMVIAIWATMLESASENEVQRGVLSGWIAEDTAALIGCKTEEVEMVFAAFQKRVLTDKVLSSWEKRNPKRERDDDSAERVQRHRDAKKETQRQVTPCNAKNSLEEIREEKIRKEGKEEPSAIPSPVEPKFPSEFEAFWKQSTRRGSKTEALSQWKRIRPDSGLIDSICAGMTAWLQSEQWEVQRMQPHVYRWLRRRGWTEVVPERSIPEHLRGSFIDHPIQEPHPPHWCPYCDIPHEHPCLDGICCGWKHEIACPEFTARYDR